MKVFISVSGGVAEVIKAPEHIEVVIIDYDNIDKQDLATCAVCGIDFHENSINMMDYPVDMCVHCEAKL